MRTALKDAGVSGPLQLAGSHFAMGCVALEITQRCNLDCALCYLSDHSEAVRDVPLEEIYRRIDRIRDQYGPHTNVQITGGDPTLRARDELIAITRRVRERGLVPSLFTNGIKATRDLLRDLAEAGLRDVAFHVDMTQGRKGFANERALNALRLEYMERVRGLGLHCIFNTTVFDDNLADVEKLAGFFRREADLVRMASFQLQAETGRGVLGAAGADGLTVPGVLERIERGAEARLHFDWPQIGHPDCNRYGSLFVAGRRAEPVFDDEALFAAAFSAGRGLRFDRHKPLTALRSALAFARKNPSLVARFAGYGWRKAMALAPGLAASGGKLRKLTFYVHNFMDAGALDAKRCEACVFMTMTSDGPISMCVHNAKRDAFILQPVKMSDGQVWRPLKTGDPGAELPLKLLKGRRRQEADARRRAN